MWKQTFFDGFNGTTLDSSLWGRYSGPPKHDAISTWDPAKAFVRDGHLVLRTSYENGRWISGGVSNAKSGARRYGKWLVRYRIPKAAGVSYVVLLYPKAGGWPPEIDIAEDYQGGNRTKAMSVTHWGAQNSQIIKHIRADFSNWVTVGAITKPGRISYLVNGKVQATVLEPKAVPAEQMWMGIQTQVNRCSDESLVCVNSSTPKTVDMQVDWVAHYEASS